MQHRDESSPLHTLNTFVLPQVVTKYISWLWAVYAAEQYNNDEWEGEDMVGVGGGDLPPCPPYLAY